MHRSGTSALTRMLGFCGADLPQRQLPANSFNSTGYWESAEIVALNVAPAQWRRGIGRRLMAALAAWSAERGLLRLQLLADRTNFSALDFYNKSGWLPTRLMCLRKKCPFN